MAWLTGRVGERDVGERDPVMTAPQLNHTPLPGRDGQSESPAQQLRRRLREELSTRLSERIRADEDAGHPAMTPAQRRVLAETVLADAAEAHTQTELARGGQLVAPEVEQRVIAAVLDEVFGLAGLEPLLRNPDIENININGDRVFVRYADLCRVRHKSAYRTSL